MAAVVSVGGLQELAGRCPPLVTQAQPLGQNVGGWPSTPRGGTEGGDKAGSAGQPTIGRRRGASIAGRDACAGQRRAVRASASHTTHSRVGLLGARRRREPWEWCSVAQLLPPTQSPASSGRRRYRSVCISGLGQD